MSFVFLHHPVVLVLFVLTLLAVLPAARWKRTILAGGGCVLSTVALVLAALTCAVPYEELLLLLLVPLLLFWVLAKEGRS